MSNALSLVIGAAAVAGIVAFMTFAGRKYGGRQSLRQILGIRDGMTGREWREIEDMLRDDAARYQAATDEEQQ